MGGKELPDYYHIKNNSAKRYFKDSTLIYESGKDFKIRMGNVTLEIDGLKEDQSLEDKWYELADEFSNWHFESGQEYSYDNIEGFRRNYYKKMPWISDFKRYSYEEDQYKKTIHNFNIAMGLNNWLDKGDSLNGLADDSYSVKPWGSWYFGLSSVNKTHLKNILFLEWGTDLVWYNWKLEDPSYQVTKATTQVNFAQPANINDIEAIKSKLVACYLNVSLVPLIDFAQGTRKVIVNEAGSFKWNRSKKIGFRIGVGGYLGYRMYGRSKYVHKEDNKLRNKEKDNGNFYLSNVRYGLRGRVGWRGMDLFVNYDLNQVFTSGKGPELNAFSFGIIL